MEKQYTFDENILSDLYKDTFGTRPGEFFWSEWDAADNDRKQEMWDAMVDELGREIEREQQEQLAVERHLERIVIPNIQSYLNGCSREDAIRHLHETYDTHGDVEYLEFNLGVRYGYLSGSLKVGF
jgi:hypothetical protein